MPLSSVLRTCIATVATLSFALVASSTSSASAPTISAPAASAGTSSSQQQLDAVMSLRPGGIQVSDNAVVWGNGDVVLVVPSPGQRTAPAGLGNNVRKELLTTPALRRLDTTSSVNSANTTSAAQVAQAADAWHGCPGGYTVKDYYCFYQYSDWGGRRVQFSGDTSPGYADEWGFDNGTTSWVSRDVDCIVEAFNYKNLNPVNRLWTEQENSMSSYVGSANSNKLSAWTCR